MTTDAQGLLRGLRPEREYGTWLLVQNGIANFDMKRPLEFHPWVLVQPSDDTRPTSIAIPRTSTGGNGIVHKPHKHGCGIDKEGRLVPIERRPLTRKLIATTDIVCVEPDPAALKASLKTGRR